MPNTLKNLVRSLVAGAATAYVTAGAAEVITIKRIKITNILAAGGATVNASLWAGSAADDAHAIFKSIPLAPGESVEMDPTMLVLNNNESLYAQGSVANDLNITVDGLSQT